MRDAEVIGVAAVGKPKQDAAARIGSQYVSVKRTLEVFPVLVDGYRTGDYSYRVLFGNVIRDVPQEFQGYLYAESKTSQPGSGVVEGVIQLRAGADPADYPEGWPEDWADFVDLDITDVRISGAVKIGLTTGMVLQMADSMLKIQLVSRQEVLVVPDPDPELPPIEEPPAQPLWVNPLFRSPDQ